MGVQFDRILDGFDGPFEKLTDFAKVAGRHDRDGAGARGLLLHPQANDSFIVVNRLLAAGEDVSWLENGPMGTARSTSRRSRRRGRSCRRRRPSSASASRPRRPRRPDRRRSCASCASACSIPTAGSMPSGWTRLVFENFEFPYDARVPAGLDGGNLRAKFDVLVFNGAGLGGRWWRRTWRWRGAAPAGDDAAGRRRRGGAPGGAGAGRGAGGGGRRRPGARPAARASRRSRSRRNSRSRQGSVGRRRSTQISSSSKEGGTVIAIGAAARARFSVRAAARRIICVENGAPLPREKYYVPGAVLRVAVDERIRSRTARQGARHLLRQQPGLKWRRTPAAQGRPQRRVVRRARRRCAAAGRGARSISTRASRSSRPASEGPRVPVRHRRCCSDRSRTAPTSSSSTACICRSRPSCCGGEAGSR